MIFGKSPFDALAVRLRTVAHVLNAWLHSAAGNSSAQRRGRYCSAGHPMDPNWTSCPRCEAERRAHEKTAPEASPAAHSPIRSGSPSMNRTPTSITSSDQEAPRTAGRATVAGDSAPAATAASRPRPVDRKITGVLVTFSRRPHGQLFIVYEGRNIIGSGTVASEDDRDCDIQVKDDRELSNEHALVLCQRNRYQLIDLNSTNGTCVDGGEPIVRVDLADNATIRTGATDWIFRTILTATAPATPPAPSDPDSPVDPQ